MDDHKKMVIACLKYHSARVLSAKCNATKQKQYLEDLLDVVLWELGISKPEYCASAAPLATSTKQEVG